MADLPAEDMGDLVEVDLASEWAEVAETLAPPPEAPEPPPGHQPADLRIAMGNFAARRDLRRILIAFGAIGKPRAEGQTGRPVRPEDVVGAFITAPPELIRELLTKAGAVTDVERIERFTGGIAAAGRACDPSDPRAVERWVTTVATLLRDDHSRH